MWYLKKIFRINNEMTEFNWDDSAVLLLVDKYQENVLLWNPRHMDFKNRNKRSDAIREIASLFNIASSEIERKLKNLSSHYFREKRKYEESEKSGSGREDVQLPKWFAYKALSFLNDKHTPVATLNSHTPVSTHQILSPFVHKATQIFDTLI